MKAATLRLCACLAILMAVAACSPDRSLDTGTPRWPDYCPCEIPPSSDPAPLPNLF